MNKAQRSVRFEPALLIKADELKIEISPLCRDALKKAVEKEEKRLERVRKK